MSPPVAHIRMAWWLRPWLIGLYVVAALTGARPDTDKVGRMMARALRIRLR